MRKVKCIKNTRFSGNKWEKISIEGWFHGWGCDYNEFDTGPGNFTIAIVEDSEGIIHKIDPGDVEFVEPIKEPLVDPCKGM